ncbi:MAG: 3-ketoacyl-(acyl-carrier-protein) reductase [Parcubacteria group bacterium GW2011_GWA1_38_7]|nr:MAG: 3-ketoacyl-(acyl-carrier-protein) reductase [Parcubacteria group bacterium GW2011_GWA1_38_7]
MKRGLKIALVTGVSTGIGKGITEFLSKNGYLVHATYNESKKEIYQAFGKNRNVIIHQLNVSNEKEVITTLDNIKRESKKLDLLVNNASVDFLVTIEDMTSIQWDETFNVRAKGTFLLTKYSLELLRKCKKSTIINITSSWAYETQPSFPAAASAEAAKMNFTKTCAVTLAKYGIRTHSVNPGVTRTPLWDPWGVDDKGWEQMAKNNPLGRNCTSLDVAKVIYYLDSDEAEYLNGEEIYVNGGNHLRNL